MNSKVQGPQCGVWTVDQRFLHSHQCTRRAVVFHEGKTGPEGAMCLQHAKKKAAREERWTGEAYRLECEALKRRKEAREAREALQASIQEEAKILAEVVLGANGEEGEEHNRPQYKLACLVLKYGLNLDSVVVP
jgi:hypothetical protein